MSEQRVDDETIIAIIRGDGYAIPTTGFGIEDIETLLACDLRDSRAEAAQLRRDLSRVEAQRDAIAGLADERLAQVEAVYANVMARYNSDAQIILKVGRLMKLIDTNGLRGLPHWLRDALGSLVETAHDVMDRRPAAQPDEEVGT